MSELLPCPFCQAPNPSERVEHLSGLLFASIDCDVCGGSQMMACCSHNGAVRRSVIGATFAELHTRWNRRAGMAFKSRKKK